MKTRGILPLLVAFALMGCDQPDGSIGRTAESMRTATERMASNSNARSRAREAQILAEAIEIGERDRDVDAEALALSQRYEVRRDGNTWAVYDLATGRYARRGERTTAGLSRDSAEQAAYELQRDENESRFKAAIDQTIRDDRRR